MPRRLLAPRSRRLLAPPVLALHALAVVAVYVLVRLGLWQWSTAEVSGRVQNYAYAVEWWLFAGFAVFLWIKVLVDLSERRPAPDDAPPPPVPAPPPVLVDDEDDPELAAYNRHLAELHARSQERG